MKNMKFYVLLLGFSFFSFLKANFDSVLLIINYTFPYYNSIPLLKKAYTPYFKNIVFYGPTPHKDVYDLPHNEGYFSYLCIADAMQRFPDFDGYFFLMDDCILAPWFLEHLDQTKIWYPQIGFCNSETGNAINLKKGKKATYWQWWNTKWGYKPMKKSFKQIPSSYKAVLENNWGANHVVAAYSDLVYIPAPYKNSFIALATIFGNHNAFLESALPTIISCLTPKQEWVWMRGVGTDRRDPIKSFNHDMVFNHPLKLSDPKNCSFFEYIFDEHALHASL